jgi:phosphoribosylglycinamide formyltransferase-1
MKKIALFAYDFPHRKTHDFILDLICAGQRDFVVMAVGKKQLKNQDPGSYFNQNLKLCPPLSAFELCERFDIPYIDVDHSDVIKIGEIVKHHKLEIGIISGARILRGEVIALFPGGVINFHPGKIPETSGLDSFFYTLKNNVPAGVTTHYIDHRVDAGLEIYFDQVEVGIDCSAEILLENVYQMQRIALRRVIAMIQSDDLRTTQITRPAKNNPMTPVEKYETLAHYSTWQYSRYFEQKQDKLILSCSDGNVEAVEKIITIIPRLLHHRNEMGWTPIIVAAYHNHYQLVELLLKRGANPNDCGSKGTTVLMYAKTKLINQQSCNYSLLDLLFNHGADATRLDCYGKNILEYVVESGDQRMVQYFMNRMGINDGIH